MRKAVVAITLRKVLHRQNLLLDLVRRWQSVLHARDGAIKLGTEPLQRFGIGEKEACRLHALNPLVDLAAQRSGALKAISARCDELGPQPGTVLTQCVEYLAAKNLQTAA